MTRTDCPDWRLERLAEDVTSLQQELAKLREEERERRDRRFDLITRSIFVTIIALIVANAVVPG